jgi:hypothetical protein
MPHLAPLQLNGQDYIVSGLTYTVLLMFAYPLLVFVHTHAMLKAVFNGR